MKRNIRRRLRIRANVRRIMQRDWFDYLNYEADQNPTGYISGQAPWEGRNEYGSRIIRNKDGE